MMNMNIRTPGPTDFPALQNLWQEAFGDTLEFINTFFQTAFDCNRCFCVIVEGHIVAALYWFDCSYYEKPVAYLYGVATAKAWQGQGICHRLITHTHKYLRKSGYAGVILVPGNPFLFDFYESMGYKISCYLQEFRCRRVTETHSLRTTTNTECAPLFLRPVSITEYAALRKQLLPKDGIIQENICLEFLKTQARLYAGPDFILAAHLENNMLLAIELLGNSAVASQILYTLNCQEGLFRTPGTEKPFAMYYPLQKSKLPIPYYFGLAFD